MKINSSIGSFAVLVLKSSALLLTLALALPIAPAQENQADPAPNVEATATPLSIFPSTST
jgi:hypothetical protein